MGTRPSGAAPGSRSTGGRWRPRSPGSPPISRAAWPPATGCCRRGTWCVWRLTGEVLTDATLASRTGLYDTGGEVVPELAGAAAGKLPPVVPLGPRGRGPAGGARRRAGAAAGDPGGDRGRRPPVRGPRGRRLARAAHGQLGHHGQRVGAHGRGPPRPAAGRGRGLARPPPAGGCSRAASRRPAPSWPGWGGSVGRDPDELARLAADSPPGARGVVAVPWLDGARAPWWRDDARAGFVGLASAHDAGDLARAVLESVAWEVGRCLVAVTSGRPGGPPAVGLTLGGRGPASRSGWTSSPRSPACPPPAGARARRPRPGPPCWAASAIGRALALDQLDPVVAEIEPDPAGVDLYRALRPVADRVAAARPRPRARRPVRGRR